VRNSHERLAAAVTPLTDDQVSGPSFASEWTIAQVASHLGSGAEIFSMLLAAGLDGTAPPGADQYRPVWEAWNAKQPAAQVRDAMSANLAFLDQVAALPAGDQARWRLEVFGTQRTLTDLVRMRLSEHAVHTWDIAVELDPAAVIAGDATGLIIDSLPVTAARAGKGTAAPVTVHVTTSHPDRQFLLELGTDGARLAPAASRNGAATLRLPGEAFIRLVYGRLDPAHTPASAEVSGTDLDILRRSFPGF
jgi:uncharacterized protein (TIGR03083 family)